MAIIIVKFSPNAAARRRGLSFRAEELEDVQARMGKLLSDLALELKLRGKALKAGGWLNGYMLELAIGILHRCQPSYSNTTRTSY